MAGYAPRSASLSFVVIARRLFGVGELDNIRRFVSGIDGGFHVRMEVLAVLACSFHR
jgi:hypothetical protein